jgi:hypothetical protein
MGAGPIARPANGQAAEKRPTLAVGQRGASVGAREAGRVTAPGGG